MDETYQEVRLEDWVKGPLQQFDSQAARESKQAIEDHFEAEWNSDIEATMRTIHPDDPWQAIPGLGVDVRGFDAVREYYENRFQSWPGPAMDHFDRVTVTDTCVYFEGELEIQPSGSFGGIAVEGKPIKVPALIVVDCREGKVLGETVHLDSAAVLGQVGVGSDA
jgi:predicted ester cyclase